MGIEFSSPYIVDKILKIDTSDLEDIFKDPQISKTDLLKFKKRVKGAFLRNRDKRKVIEKKINNELRRRNIEGIQQRQQARDESRTKIADQPLLETPIKPERLSFAAENKAPLVDGIRTEPDNLERFKAHLNQIIGKYSGIKIDSVQYHMYDPYEPMERIEVKFIVPKGVPRNVKRGLQTFLSARLSEKYYNDPKVKNHEGYVLPKNKEIVSSKNPFKRIKNSMKMLLAPQKELMMTSKYGDTHQKETNSLSITQKEKKRLPIVGFFTSEINRLRGKNRHSSLATREVTLTFDPNRWGEADVGYMAAQVSTILSESMQYSGGEQDLAQRRTLFLDTYHQLLSDQYDPAKREDLVGLGPQLDDIDTNLITPIVSGLGNPKTIALIGPPGTGKTLTIRQLMTQHPEVLFLPLDVSLFSKKNSDGSNVFEATVETVQKKANRLRLPVVIVMDDAEALFGSAVNQQSGLAGGISAKDRSRILNLLNGRGESGFNAILSLNHPEILDVAAQRRLHLVTYELPSDEQRQAILRMTVKRDWLPELSDNLDVEEIIENLLNLTEGFNSSYLTEIKSLVQNMILRHERQQLALMSQQNLVDLFVEATKSVKQQANLDELKKAERVALDFVGRSSSSSTFHPFLMNN